MQTLREIREILSAAGLSPRKMFGQNFLIDHNLMTKLIELADVRPDATVLEVGPGTGSLTEELLARCGRLTAVEIDRGMAEMLAARLGGRANFNLICGDVLADKHHINPEVIAKVAPAADLVSNLPYNIATPLLAQCLIESWKFGVRSSEGMTTDYELPASGSELRTPNSELPCLFRRMTFTVQKEVADRLMARANTEAYGPVTVLVALLGRATPGPLVPAEAFWPRPTVASRIARIDFDPQVAARLKSVDALSRLLTLCFGQRRKQIGSILRRAEAPWAPNRLAAALSEANIPPTSRAEQLEPERFLIMANALGTPIS